MVHGETHLSVAGHLVCLIILFFAIIVLSLAIAVRLHGLLSHVIGFLTSYVRLCSILWHYPPMRVGLWTGFESESRVRVGAAMTGKREHVTIVGNRH